MSEWQRTGLPGEELSIVELHHVALTSRSRVWFKHARDADLLEEVRIVPGLPRHH